jgi:hypothetical protein
MPDIESGSPFIKRFRAEYQAALSGMETTVAELVKANKEMRAIMTLGEYFTKIIEIHEQLTTYYTAISNNVAVLRKYESVRLQQWGHDLAPTMKLVEGARIDDDEKEKYILGEMRKQGYKHRHWLIKERLLVEIDYMLDVLVSCLANECT